MFKWLLKGFKIGVVYRDGKILIYKVENNPETKIEGKPSWAVDIREILAMLFVGSAALCLIIKGNINEAMMLLTGLLGYATGRTVPGGKTTS